MEFESINISVYIIIFVLFVKCSSSSEASLTENVEYKPYRHRRSFESRHKGKENVSNNGVKPLVSGESSVFATENCTVVAAQSGSRIILPCIVKKSTTGVVTWIRKRDYRLLTVGLTTYIADARFRVEHVRHLQNWDLLIRYVHQSDAGMYECQVSTHPPTSISVELKVTEASAEIVGAPDLHLRAGSQLRLVCTFRQSTEPPSYVFWYHEQRMINYDDGVQVNVDRWSSVLMVAEADKHHNGNYTCSPSNAVPAFIVVHVLNATAEEKPAAMQHANTTSRSSYLFVNVMLFFITCVFQNT